MQVRTTAARSLMVRIRIRLRTLRSNQGPSHIRGNLDSSQGNRPSKDNSPGSNPGYNRTKGSRTKANQEGSIRGRNRTRDSNMDNSQGSSRTRDSNLGRIPSKGSSPPHNRTRLNTLPRMAIILTNIRIKTTSLMATSLSTLRQLMSTRGCTKVLRRRCIHRTLNTRTIMELHHNPSKPSSPSLNHLSNHLVRITGRHRQPMRLTAGPLARRHHPLPRECHTATVTTRRGLTLMLPTGRHMASFETWDLKIGPVAMTQEDQRWISARFMARWIIPPLQLRPVARLISWCKVFSPSTKHRMLGWFILVARIDLLL